MDMPSSGVSRLRFEAWFGLAVQVWGMVTRLGGAERGRVTRQGAAWRGRAGCGMVTRLGAARLGRVRRGKVTWPGRAGRGVVGLGMAW